MSSPRKPELLAPAGDLASLEAALAAGADAVYFGLDDGFNARARAANFSTETLPETVARIHRAGARAYLTLNTLIFEPELPVVERIVRRAAESGVDALIVQDPAVALLARAICPALEVHASTQMTISSPEAARFAKALGATRMVAPRELSVDEIRTLAAGTDLELEVFIHGALCVSWSGQCLTSEAWGGRSANRGQCAQSCRMPYQLVVDGAARELGEVEYLLSPKDLAGMRAVPALAEIGVHGLKIEGRQKGPEYVATAVEGYRRWLDSIADGKPDLAAAERDLEAMALTYTRGFSDGFLGGSDHQTLVEGRFPKHRGVYLGRVRAVRGDDVVVEREPAEARWTGALATDGRRGEPAGVTSAALPGTRVEPAVEPRPGQGVGFDAGNPEDKHEPGGPLFRVDKAAGGWVLGFGTPGPDLARVAPGQRVWLTGDPSQARRVDKLRATEPTGRWRVALSVSGAAGQPLRVEARAAGRRVVLESPAPLETSRGEGLSAALLADKLGAFGGTMFSLAPGGIDAGALAPGLHVPVSILKELRRRIVSELGREIERGAARTIDPAPAIARVRAASPASWLAAAPGVVALCRTDAHLEAAIAAGVSEVELDWMELSGLGRAVARAREAKLGVTIATMRVQKPGEEGYDARIAALAPDAVLVRHWGAMVHFRELPEGVARPVLHGDFSLNVTNSITAAHLLEYGLSTLTVAHDLDETQLMAMLEHAPAERFAIAVHHHIATFHTEHCVYAHLLSNGRDYKSCGRPCESHQVALEDRVGLVHPVVVDVGCRNTVFNAQAQSAAGLVPRLLERGLRRFRVELVRESRAEAERVLTAYRELVAGKIAPGEAVRRAGVHEQFGVTRGTMRVLG